MLKKCAVPFAVIIAVILIVFVSIAPIFNGYSTTFEIYRGDSGSQIQTVDYKGYVLAGKIKGEAVTIDKQGFDLDKFLRAFRAKIKVMETVGQGVNYYAYSTKIPYSQRVKGKTVNLQIFMGETTVKVGTPMIYGSF